MIFLFATAIGGVFGILVWTIRIFIKDFKLALGRNGIKFEVVITLIHNLNFIKMERMVTQQDLDKNPDLKKQGISVNQHFDFKDSPGEVNDPAKQGGKQSFQKEPAIKKK